MATKKIANEVDGVNSPTEMPMATPAINTPTPENTPVPGGGRWLWCSSRTGWIEVIEDQPLQPGDVGALQTPTQE